MIEFQNRVYWVYRTASRDSEKISVHASDALDAVEYGQQFWNRKKGIWAEKLTPEEIVERDRYYEFAT